jgi:hypothetical protein
VLKFTPYASFLVSLCNTHFLLFRYCLCFTTFPNFLLVSFWVSHISGDACLVSIYCIYLPLYVFSLLFLLFFLCRIRQIIRFEYLTFRLDLCLRPPNVTSILRTIYSKNPIQSILKRRYRTTTQRLIECLNQRKSNYNHPIPGSLLK